MEIKWFRNRSTKWHVPLINSFTKIKIFRHRMFGWYCDNAFDATECLHSSVPPSEQLPKRNVYFVCRWRLKTSSTLFQTHYERFYPYITWKNMWKIGGVTTFFCTLCSLVENVTNFNFHSIFSLFSFLFACSMFIRQIVSKWSDRVAIGNDARKVIFTILNS